MKALRFLAIIVCFMSSCLIDELYSLTSTQIYDQWKKEIKVLKKWIPLKNQSEYIMFWRPQKVGSSTVLSILVSYGYRYNILHKRRGFSNSFCTKMLACLQHSNYSRHQAVTKHYNYKDISKLAVDIKENLSEHLNYHISSSHQLCNLPTKMIQYSLPCAFLKPKDMPSYSQQSAATTSRAASPLNIKEIFLVRNPLSRIISIYYFWGELYKFKQQTSGESSINPFKKFFKAKGKRLKDQPRVIKSKDRRRLRNDANRIGKNTQKSEIVEGSLFKYHGNESSVPSLKLATDFADNLPLFAGMPGPTATWTSFSDSLSETLDILRGDRVMSMVIERLDESLVVASHYLNWSIADVINVMNRKALSTHPKYTEWPAEAIKQINISLVVSGEYDVYDAANEALERRMTVLAKNGVNVQDEVILLRAIRERVTKICLQEDTLNVYRVMMQNEGFLPHYNPNKLRDTEDQFSDKGHEFSFNGDLLYSYDICGSCESHAILLGLQLNKSTTVETAPSLFQLDSQYRQNNINFQKCPLKPKPINVFENTTIK